MPSCKTHEKEGKIEISERRPCKEKLEGVVEELELTESISEVEYRTGGRDDLENDFAEEPLS